MNYDFNQDLLNSIKERAEIVRNKIEDVCRECGRSSSDVTLIGVSKVFPVEYAEAAVAGGLLDLGENRVQELVPKIQRLEELELNPRWHLIGTLQKNKVKYIIGKPQLADLSKMPELERKVIYTFIIK